MGGLGGVPPFLVSTTDLSPALSASIRAGQVLSGTVVTDGEGLAVAIRGARIKLPAGEALPPGTRVTVQVHAGEGQPLRFVVQPELGAPVPNAPSTPDALAAIGKILAALGLGNAATVEDAATILPSNLPQTDSAVRLVLGLLAAREGLSRSFTALFAALQTAVEAGVLPASTLEALRNLVKQFQAADDADLKGALTRAARSGSTSLESRILSALDSGQAAQVATLLREDLRGLLLQVKSDGALAEFLSGTRGAAEFNEAADRILDRLNGALLQNTRGLDQPYRFVELSQLPGGFVESAQIHFFSDGSRSGSEGESGVSMAVLDVSLTNLGDLWVSLRAFDGHCDCRLKATASSVAALIEEHAHELESGIAAAGYRSASVVASEWDGDRFGAVASLFRPYAGLNEAV